MFRGDDDIWPRRARRSRPSSAAPAACVAAPCRSPYAPPTPAPPPPPHRKGPYVIRNRFDPHGSATVSYGTASSPIMHSTVQPSGKYPEVLSFGGTDVDGRFWGPGRNALDREARGQRRQRASAYSRLYGDSTERGRLVAELLYLRAVKDGKSRVQHNLLGNDHGQQLLMQSLSLGTSVCLDGCPSTFTTGDPQMRSSLSGAGRCGATEGLVAVPPPCPAPRRPARPSSAPTMVPSSGSSQSRRGTALSSLEDTITTATATATATQLPSRSPSRASFTGSGGGCRGQGRTTRLPSTVSLSSPVRQPTIFLLTTFGSSNSRQKQSAANTPSLHSHGTGKSSSGGHRCSLDSPTAATGDRTHRESSQLSAATASADGGCGGRGLWCGVSDHDDNSSNALASSNGTANSSSTDFYCDPRAMSVTCVPSTTSLILAHLRSTAERGSGGHTPGAVMPWSAAKAAPANVIPTLVATVAVPASVLWY